MLALKEIRSFGGRVEELTGQVLHVDPAAYQVAVYGYDLQSGWWGYPAQDQSLTSIRTDGTWTCDISPPENAQVASKVAVYLVPVTLRPVLWRERSQPSSEELKKHAVAWLEATRTPFWLE
jgi:hypothetical protein